MAVYAQRAAERRAALERALARFVESARVFPDVRAIYVFGSLVQGEIGPRSDLDLLVVRETSRRGPMRGEDLAIAALLDIEYDLLVLTPEEFAHAPERGSFWGRVVAEAKCVYAA